MSILFSRIKAMTDKQAALFLVGGCPKSQEDLAGWTAFDSFADMLDDNETITVSVESFEYGEGEAYDATPEEIAYIYIRESKRPDFIESRAKKVDEYSFIMWLKK